MQNSPENVQNLFQIAFETHQKGQFEKAIDLYDQVLNLDQHHFNSWHLSGVVKFQLGAAQEAVNRIEKAISIYDQHATAYNNLGVAYQEIKAHQPALNAFTQAIALNPNSASAYSNRGNTWLDLNEIDKGIEDYLIAVKLAPDSASTHSCLGYGLQKKQLWDQALEQFNIALKLDPHFFDALNNRATTYLELDQAQQAIQDLQHALQLRPNHADATNNYINALRNLNQLEQATPLVQSFVQHHPQNSMAWNQLGILTRTLGDLAEGICYFEKGVELNPLDHRIWGNLGNAYHDLHQYEKALKAFSTALSVKPDYIEAQWNRSLVYLSMGEYEKAWPDYELRWQFQKNLTINPSFTQPRWQGQELKSAEKLLIYVEQGLGDTIQFIRYLEQICLRNDQFYVQVQSPLFELYKINYPKIQWLKLGDTLPAFDFHIPLMSLPFLFHTRFNDVPPVHPLCATDDLQSIWQKRLGKKDRPRIGLVWQGNPSHKNDRRRSIPLDLFIPILSNKYEWIILQKEISDSDRLKLSHMAHCRYFSNEIHDFLDTTALCESLDLIITVDTSVAHLAATIGKLTWILLTHSADWRWQNTGDTTPWYPSVKLLRQTKRDSWLEILNSLTPALEKQFF